MRSDMLVKNREYLLLCKRLLDFLHLELQSVIKIRHHAQHLRLR